jgi:hypothetical protein
VPDTVSDIIRQLQASRFHGLEGARVVATVPVAEGLINQLIAATLPPGAPVRSVAIQPEAGDRLSVRIVPKAAMLPAVTLKLVIEEQPRLPESAVLVLRMATLGGLFGLASGAISGMLPPGVRLDGERIRVDLETIAVEHGQMALIQYVTGLSVHSEAGRVILKVEAGVG